MKINLLKTALIGALSLSALVSTSASAHGRWLLPSHTSLSGDKAHYVMTVSYTHLTLPTNREV